MKSNILYILAFTFAASACLKIGNIAMASETNSDSEAKLSSPAASDSTEMSAPLSTSDHAVAAEIGDANSCVTPVLAQTLLQQQDSLAAKQLDIAQREAALMALEARVRAQIDDVRAVEASIRDHSYALQRTATEDIAHLVQMYETMKPQNAAEIFNQMNPAFAAGFLRQINGSKAGLILAGMEAKNSYQVSLIMAEQGAAWRNTE